MSNVINLDLKKEHSKKTLYWILRYIIKHHKHYGDVGYIPTSWLALSKFLNYKNHFTIKKCLWTPDSLRVYVNRIDPEVKNWFVDNFDFNQILINTKQNHTPYLDKMVSENVEHYTGEWENKSIANYDLNKHFEEKDSIEYLNKVLGL
tara:strand:- start:505 stop:948 length:444 start_codon:yes stop_codon:yes gene_type:complete